MPSSSSHIHTIIVDQPAKTCEINICRARAPKSNLAKV